MALTQREKLAASLEKEKSATEKAIKTFFDTSKSTKQRSDAFAVSGTFNTKADVSKALKVFRDTAEDPEIRAAAILGLVGSVAVSEKFVDELIALLDNESAPGVMKDAAMQVLQTGTFISPILDSKRPEYNNALRTLVESDSPKKIKLRAAEHLAMEKDEFIQGKLLHGLENPEDQFVKPEVAIQLLSYDLHSDAYPVLRQIAEDPPNKRAKKEAIRNLSADPDSAGLLQKVLDDKDEDEEIRHVAAIGLQSVQPELLQNSLVDILTDKNEKEELRTALLNTLTYTADTEITDNNEDFQKKLKKIKDKSNSRKMKKVYKFYERNKLK